MGKIYDVIIIGGGPAGYTAALYAARAGLEVAVVEKMSAGGQMALTDVIENYPGFDEGIDGFELGAKMQRGAERFGAKTLFTEVNAVELSGEIKRISTGIGELLAHSVIIATGASPRKLKLENEEKFTGRGVHYCAHCDGRFYKGKTVVVIGGGNSAVSDALYLSKLAKKVFVVHRRDTLRATKVYHEPLMNRENVEFVWNSTPIEYIGEQRMEGICVKNLKTQELRDISCDGVFVSIGRRPDSDLFDGQIELDENRYVIADETTRTSVNGVFVAGDIRTKELRQVVTAVSDGANAAYYAEKYLELKK